MPIAMMLIYLVLATPARVFLLFGADGLKGNWAIVVRAAGMSVRFDGRLTRWETVVSKRITHKNEKGKPTTAKEKMMAAVHRALRMESMDVVARIGLDEAWSTALAVGGLRAAALSALSVWEKGNRLSLQVVPDFSAPCFCVFGACIFSVTAGDIILAAVSAATKKR